MYKFLPNVYFKMEKVRIFSQRRFDRMPKLLMRDLFGRPAFDQKSSELPKEVPWYEEVPIDWDKVPSHIPMEHFDKAFPRPSEMEDIPMV